MNKPATEQASERYREIDTWSTERVLTAIATAQREAVSAVAAAVPQITRAADAIVAMMQAGGRMIYAGAGSSGLLAHVDASEIFGTYGIPADRTPVLMAGGLQALVAMRQGDEDDADSAAPAVDALDVGAGDVLVAISASGRTPFVLAALRAAKSRGAVIVGIANNADTPLLLESDHAVLLATPPEIIAGSTRMNAGTAQKSALNMLSTLIGIRLGHGYAGLMVNLQADNVKLRRRAIGVVAEAAAVDEARAAQALAEAGAIKPAILLCLGCPDVSEANRLLTFAGGDVRQALALHEREDRASRPQQTDRRTQ